MNKRSRKAKKLGALVVFLLALIQFCFSIVYGRRQDWIMFSCCLATYVIMAVFFTGILLQLGMDSHFLRLEKLISEQKAEEGG
jgi:hypothetical protein